MRSIITITFGALAPPIEDQLRSQGFEIELDFSDIQRSIDDIARLYILGLLPEGVTRAARNMILKRVRTIVSEHQPSAG